MLHLVSAAVMLVACLNKAMIAFALPVCDVPASFAFSTCFVAMHAELLTPASSVKTRCQDFVSYCTLMSHTVQGLHVQFPAIAKSSSLF